MPEALPASLVGTMIKNSERKATRRVHGRSFVVRAAMRAKVTSISATLAAALVVLAPAARGQNQPAPSPAPDCVQLCKEGFNTQLTDESQKKAFTSCVVQNKCPSGKLDPSTAPRQNPLLGPFHF